jgi:hypothetical protein
MYLCNLDQGKDSLANPDHARNATRQRFIRSGRTVAHAIPGTHCQASNRAAMGSSDAEPQYDRDVAAGKQAIKKPNSTDAKNLDLNGLPSKWEG